MALGNLRHGLAVGIACVAMVASPVGAQTLQFGATACGGTGFLLSGASFSESGFSISTPGQFGLASWCSGNPSYPGSPALFINTSGASASLSAAGGAAFSIQSIDLATIFERGSAGSATFTGSVFGGGTVSSTFNFSASSGAPVFSTFSFGPGWTNVTDVKWNQSGSFATGHQFDNIVLGGAVSSVPEPSAMILLGSGILVIGAFARRRRTR